MARKQELCTSIQPTKHRTCPHFKAHHQGATTYCIGFEQGRVEIELPGGAYYIIYHCKWDPPRWLQLKLG